MIDTKQEMNREAVKRFVQEGERIGVGKGFFHILKIENSRAEIEGKVREDGHGEKHSLPIQWVSQIARIEPLELKVDAQRKQIEHRDKKIEQLEKERQRQEGFADKYRQEANRTNKELAEYRSKATAEINSLANRLAAEESLLDGKDDTIRFFKAVSWFLFAMTVLEGLVLAFK